MKKVLGRPLGHGQDVLMIRGVIAVAALLSLMGSSPPASATTFPAVGGSGDAAAVDTCPAGMYLIGLKGRTGLWIDQVQIVCAPVTPAEP